MVRVLFIHPDLGIGGAERLVVDAALALKSRGHTVSFLTNHHDPTHCFEETRDGTLSVFTVGCWIPQHICGRLLALCAYLRMIYAALYVTLCLSKKMNIDLIFCDQISLGIPLLRLAKNKPKILFYCHYPDQLLSSKGGLLKQMYRAPLNFLEELTTGKADCVLVNSKFTSKVFKNTFKKLKIEPDCLYPSLNTNFFDNCECPTEENAALNFAPNVFIFLSINRFERKKNISLVLQALKKMEKSMKSNEFKNIRLVIAGGYDTRVSENKEHYNELVEQCFEFGLMNKVTFLQSPSDIMKVWLLKKCDALIYTPANEHFGIVPLEGMYMGTPVIAVNSGGPTETVISGQTGFLCEQNPNDFAKAMVTLVHDRRLAQRMGDMGKARVQQTFSFEAFTDKLNFIVVNLVSEKDQ